jgi:magnesium transporter
VECHDRPDILARVWRRVIASSRSKVKAARSPARKSTSAPASPKQKRADAEGAEAAARCHVFGPDGSETVEFSAESVERLLAAGKFFWLDLYRPDSADFEVLTDVFKFHPLAVQDSEHFDQRAKFDEYDDFTFIVMYGAAPDDDRLVEVHCFYSERFLVTVHRDDCPAFAELRERYDQHHDPADKPSLLLYRVLDSLISSFFPILSDFDDRIDELEDQIFVSASDKQLQEMFQMKRLLVGVRKAVTPQRDSFATLMGRFVDLPGFDADDEHYFRDIYDHLIRISDLIDSYRDLLSSAMDVYLSTVSNRLNAVMKQLTVIATVFLPLTFITGFFGQNFGFLTGHITNWETFVGLGIGIELVALLLLLGFFKRRHWF